MKSEMNGPFGLGVALVGVVTALALTVWAQEQTPATPASEPTPVVTPAPATPPATETTPALNAPVSMTSPAQPTAAVAWFTCPKCHTLEAQAGKCAVCGETLAPTHILAIKEGQAYCCGCGAGCTCKAMDATMTKCSCGKDIAKVPLKGKYVCSCAADCPKCRVVSSQPGQCACGKDLTKVE